MKSIFILSILIIGLGVTVYANSIKGEFILDDYALVRNNAFIKNISYMPKIFTSDIYAGSGESRESSFYRPLQVLSYMFDYRLWKLDVRGYHITNIILHILVGLSIFWFVHLVFGDRLLSFLSGTLFVIHPVHTEAVSYISGRADPLCLLFLTLSFIFYIKYSGRRRPLFLVFSLLTYAAALLSRESSIIFPALLILYHYAFDKRTRAEAAIAVSSMTVIYIIMRLGILKNLLPEPVTSTTVIQKLPGFFAAFTNYIRLLILPLNLHMEYGNICFNITNLQVITGLIIVCALILYVYKSREKRIVFFSIAWFFITIMPQSNIYPINAYMAEHWLYMPSIGFFLILAYLLSSLYRNPRYKAAATASIALLISVYSLMTVKQNTYWIRPLSFYEKTFGLAPPSARIYNNLGIVYYEDGRIEEAISLYKRAIELKPGYPETYINLGKAYAGIGDNDKAIDSYRKAIELKPDYVTAYNNLAISYGACGRRREAVDLLKKAIEINPNYENSYYNLAAAYLVLGEIEEALDIYYRIIKQNPYSAKAYYNIGVIYKDIGRTKDAIPIFKKAIDIDPKNMDLYTNLGAIFIADRNYEDAIYYFNKALKINPDYADIHNNLAVAYYYSKRYDLAVKHCDRAIELGAGIDAGFLEALTPYRKEQR